MPRRNVAEVAAGAAVLIVAAGFLAYALGNSGTGGGGGEVLHAQFNRIDGLTVGSDVRVAGVKVGSITTASIDPKSFLANVTFAIDPALHMPKDSSAEIVSDSLLGGKYLSLVPGGDEQTIPNGGNVTITQSSVSLEELLGKFIFSVTDMVNAVKAQNGGGNAGGGNGGGGAPGGAAPASPGGPLSPPAPSPAPKSP